MGCGSSLPQPDQESDKLSSLIRRRVDSIRRRRKRVGDAITMETTLSCKMLLKDGSADHDTSHCIQTLNDDDDKKETRDEINSEKDEMENVVVEAVWRAIEEVLMAEEREYAETLFHDVHTNGSPPALKTKDVMNRHSYIPQSPSFRVYCTSMDSFDSCSTKDDEAVKNVEDVPKTEHGRRPKSMDSTTSEECSTKCKTEGDITKKTASNWKLGSTLGVKNLFVMSCYSCSSHNRARLLSRG